jgi:hypothetical protein
MFIAYGIVGLFRPFNVNFWIFYVSLCNITMWIAFRFMSADKILKYDVISKLTKFAPLQQAVDGFVQTETMLDNQIQPDSETLPDGMMEQLPQEPEAEKKPKNG